MFGFGRERGRFTFGSHLRQDLIHGWRQLRQSRAVTLVAVLSLALGIGVNTVGPENSY
jgi:hypothetical protein